MPVRSFSELSVLFNNLKTFLKFKPKIPIDILKQSQFRPWIHYVSYFIENLHPRALILDRLFIREFNLAKRCRYKK